MRSITLIAAALVAASTFATAQTAPDLEEPINGATRTVKEQVQGTLNQAAAAPGQVAKTLLSTPAAPAVGPLYATYARGDFEPPVATDTNPDPKIVEVTIVSVPAVWEFEPGVPTLVWTFNGTVPGPTIEANVGDEVIVHYTNLIDTPGGIHWHGIEVPATMDGSHVSSPEIPRGGTFDYRFRVNRPSLFWYHPHHDAAQQVERGLYGAFIVHDPAADQAIGLANETIVVLDDVLLNGAWQFDKFEPTNPRLRAEYLANGRGVGDVGEGEVLIVNGRAGRTLPVEPGVPLRLRIVNTANSRFMRLNLPNHDLHLIGTDGGLLEAPRRHPPIAQIVDPDPTHGGKMISDNDPNHGVMVTPGERADIVLTPKGASGTALPVQTHDWGRGVHFYLDDGNGGLVLNHVHSAYPSAPPEKLFDLLLAGDGQPATYSLPAHLPTAVKRLVPSTTARHLKLTMGHGAPDPTGNIVFWMQERADGTPLPFPDVTPAAANDARVGETAIWEVRNTAHGDHNFHTHGFEFQPISIEYVSCDPTLNHTESFGFLQDKDTIRIPGPPMPACYFDANRRYVCPTCPAGTAYTVLKAAVKFDPAGRGNDIEAYGGNSCQAGAPACPQADRSGGWMIHCHILEHSAHGMMTYLELRK